VYGPVTYDLVSLLRDCYIRWPRERVQDWVGRYFQLALRHGVLQPEHEGSLWRWFDLMGVQRHLKAAGIFARLCHRDGKPGYLADIPRTLEYIVEAATGSEVAWLAEFVITKVLPRWRDLSGIDG
jgi:aminoglycoside/choline kinase family phosphotransferase